MKTFRIALFKLERDEGVRREGCRPQAQPGEGAKCGYQEIKVPGRDSFDLMLVRVAIRSLILCTCLPPFFTFLFSWTPGNARPRLALETAEWLREI